MRSVDLSPEELVLLDGRVGEKTQRVIDAAKMELRLRAELPPRQAASVADIVSEAQHNGVLMWRSESIRNCHACGRDAGYAPRKRTTAAGLKGAPDYDRPRTMAAIDMAYRMVRLIGVVSVGGCTECVEAMRPALCRELATVRAQLPRRLTGRAPRYYRAPMHRCEACDWKGPSVAAGVGWDRDRDTLVPAVCPRCGAEHGTQGTRWTTPAIVGRGMPEVLTEWEVVDIAETRRKILAIARSQIEWRKNRAIATAHTDELPGEPPLGIGLRAWCKFELGYVPEAIDRANDILIHHEDGWDEFLRLMTEELAE